MVSGDYLWEGKADKIKRKFACQNYDHGGLKMADLLKFEKSIKLNWIKHITKQKRPLPQSISLCQHICKIVSLHVYQLYIIIK